MIAYLPDGINMDAAAPPTVGWYLIVLKDGDQTAQIRAEWDGEQFRTGPGEAVELKDVSSWKPILAD